MSKTSDLRRKATEAVRAKDFDRAVEIYERVCSQDSGNGTPRNELGDVFLKLGDIESAVASFTEAARLYMDFGLTNNAVAVHKKILRHEPNHLHSLWVLGDIRREQGLGAEASAAFLEFLGRYESVTESEREAFVARGLELIETMGDDPEILSTLEKIFSQWEFGQEQARVLIAKARLAHEADEHEVRDKYVEHARVAFEHLDALPDYVEFKQLVDPAAAEVAADVPDEETSFDFSDELDGDRTVVIDEETSFEFSDDDAPAFDVPKAASFDDDGGPSARTSLDSTDIDLGFDFDMDALDDAAGSSGGHALHGFGHSDVHETVPEVEIDVSGDDGFDTDAADDVPEPADDARAADESVDLLEQILSDGGFDMADAEQNQLDTITHEMQGQIGNDVDPDDHAGQYEVGMVYMDMELYEPAMSAFDVASRGDDERLRALEMKGACLLRLGRPDAALEVFEEGLAVPGHPGPSYLGLLYGVGAAHEAREDVADALDTFQRVHAVDADFLDVQERIARLRTVVGEDA